jgi:hypothetical protein
MTTLTLIALHEKHHSQKDDLRLRQEELRTQLFEWYFEHELPSFFQLKEAAGSVRRPGPSIAISRLWQTSAPVHTACTTGRTPVRSYIFDI